MRDLKSSNHSVSWVSVSSVLVVGEDGGNVSNWGKCPSIQPTRVGRVFTVQREYWKCHTNGVRPVFNLFKKTLLFFLHLYFFTFFIVGKMKRSTSSKFPAVSLVIVAKHRDRNQMMKSERIQCSLYNVHTRDHTPDSPLHFYHLS